MGLLSGLELEPEGALFLAPITLEIILGADQQAELRAALDDGGVVVASAMTTPPMSR